jgi:hypothetical protein
MDMEEFRFMRDRNCEVTVEGDIATMKVDLSKTFNLSPGGMFENIANFTLVKDDVMLTVSAVRIMPQARVESNERLLKDEDSLRALNGPILVYNRVVMQLFEIEVDRFCMADAPGHSLPFTFCFRKDGMVTYEAINIDGKLYGARLYDAEQKQFF